MNFRPISQNGSPKRVFFWKFKPKMKPGDLIFGMGEIFLFLLCTLVAWIGFLDRANQYFSHKTKNIIRRYESQKIWIKIFLGIDGKAFFGKYFVPSMVTIVSALVRRFPIYVPCRKTRLSSTKSWCTKCAILVFIWFSISIHVHNPANSNMHFGHMQRNLLTPYFFFSEHHPLASAFTPGFTFLGV